MFFPRLSRIFCNRSVNPQLFVRGVQLPGFRSKNTTLALTQVTWVTCAEWDGTLLWADLERSDRL